MIIYYNTEYLTIKFYLGITQLSRARGTGLKAEHFSYIDTVLGYKHGGG
jgi:hypothetical protein